MRLSGLAAGIATFGVLEITHNVLRYYEKIGPGLNTFSSVPETTGLLQATIGALIAIGVAFALPAEPLRADAARDARGRARRIGRRHLRLSPATRRVRLSGAIAGLAGGLYVHLLPINTESLYLDLTFITLAMLVVGGATSLWGAVVGALAVSGLDSFLAQAENGVEILGRHARPARGHGARRRRRADGARADPAAVGAHRRARVLAAAAVARMTRVCVAGAGTIGSLLAAHLAQVAEVSVLTRREEHARALNEHGLTVTGPGGLHRAGRRRRGSGAVARAGARDRRLQGQRRRAAHAAPRGALPRRDR